MLFFKFVFVYLITFDHGFRNLCLNRYFKFKFLIYDLHNIVLENNL